MCCRPLRRLKRREAYGRPSHRWWSRAKQEYSRHDVTSEVTHLRHELAQLRHERDKLHRHLRELTEDADALREQLRERAAAAVCRVLVVQKLFAKGY